MLSGAGVLAAGVLAVIGGFPVDVPMPTHAVGWVEPTCGLTRGSTAVARGDFGIAWRYNPASFAVMAFGVAGLARTALGTSTGRWLNIRLRPSLRGWIIVGFSLAVFWLYQQTNAEFIINSRI